LSKDFFILYLGGVKKMILSYFFQVGFMVVSPDDFTGAIFCTFQLKMIDKVLSVDKHEGRLSAWSVWFWTMQTPLRAL